MAKWLWRWTSPTVLGPSPTVACLSHWCTASGRSSSQKSSPAPEKTRFTRQHVRPFVTREHTTLKDLTHMYLFFFRLHDFFNLHVCCFRNKKFLLRSDMHCAVVASSCVRLSVRHARAYCVETAKDICGR